LAAEDIGGASKTVDKALAEDPGNVYAQEMQVDILVRGKAFDKAETLAQKVALANPKLAFAQAVVGDVAIARQQWAPAAAAYRKALQLEPNAHAAQRLFRTLGATPETTGEAMSFARQWLKSHANDLGMRRLVGDSLARSKDFKGARVEYEAVLKLAPQDLEATNNLVNVLILLKDPGALVLAEQALKQHPEAPSLIGSAGWAAFHAGKADRALELLRNARLRDPADLENRYMLAKVLSSLGKNDEARLELDGALTAGRTFEHEAEAKELRATLR
jgi:Flp pilus assembly protein TadD